MAEQKKGNPIIAALKTIAPYLGAAASTMLPGPMGAVAGALTRAITPPAVPGQTEAQILPPAVQPTVESITNAVTSILGDPAALARLREEEHNYALAMQKAGFDHEEKVEALAVQDRSSAREMRVKTNDWTPTIGFFLLLSGFFVALGLLFKYPIPNENKATVYTMIGSLGTLVIMAATFFYGTTRQNARNTELLAKAQPVE